MVIYIIKKQKMKNKIIDILNALPIAKENFKWNLLFVSSKEDIKKQQLIKLVKKSTNY